MKLNHQNRIFLLAALVLSIFFYTFFYGIKHGMDKTLPYPLSRHVPSLSIAIADLHYGVHGYKGYGRVGYFVDHEHFERDITDIRNYTQDPIPVQKYAQHINTTIEKALHLSNPQGEGFEYLMREDKGLIFYYKLAFMIFGYHLESFYYLYFLVLLISVVVFFINFYSRLDILNLLIIFLCAHFVVVANAPWAGIELQTVHNARFIPVLGILPLIHLVLLLFSQGRSLSKDWLLAMVQVFIFILVVNIRTSSFYQVLFLCFLFMGSAFWFWLQKPQLGRYIFNKIQHWPLTLLLSGILLLQLHMIFVLNYPYNDINARHLFWHAAYIGLSAHPQSKALYGIELKDDIAQKLVVRLTGGEYKEGFYEDHNLYEAVLQREYFKILKENPRFVIQSYFYKIPIFFNSFFDHVNGAGRFIWDWKILMIMCFSCILSYQFFIQKWFYYLITLILGLIFSLVPAFVVIPQRHLISDASLLCTMVIFIALTGLLCVIFKKQSKLMEKRC